MGALQRRLVQMGECGYCVSPHDSREFADKIIYLINHDQVRKEMGEDVLLELIIFLTLKLCQRPIMNY